MINMANPEAAEWVEAEICRIIEDYQLEFFRLDYNVETYDWFIRDEKHGVVRSAIYEYYKNTCEMFQRLRKKIPALFSRIVLPAEAEPLLTLCGTLPIPGLPTGQLLPEVLLLPTV